MRFIPVDVEQSTHEIRGELFPPCRDAHVKFSLNRWLDEKFMAISMRDEAVKSQLFRLVDALPALQSSPQVNAHLQQYLTQVADRLAPPVRTLVDHWPRNGWLGNALASFTEANVRRLAR